MRQNGEVLGLQGDSCSFGVCSEMFCNRKGHEGMLAGACSDQGRFLLPFVGEKGSDSSQVCVGGLVTLLL